MAAADAGGDLCAEISRQAHEPLAATASRVEHWLLLEYHGLWGYEPLGASALDGAVKAHLRAHLAALPRARLLFVRRPDRRRTDPRMVYAARTTEGDSRVVALDLGGYHELLDLDLQGLLAGEQVGAARALDHPLLVVCTHGKRDRCCAKFGRPLYDALRDQAEERWVWQATHVGGDRFAANLVVLPDGLYYGRVEPADAWRLLDDVLARRIALDRYRGRCSYSFAQQAAERAVREETGLSGVDDVELVETERVGSGWVVRFRTKPTGDVFEAEVVAELGELTRLTCSATELRRPRRFRASALRRL